MREYTPAGPLSLLSIISILVLIFAPATSARIWDINASGTGDAPTIQAAIDSAGTGDVIVVAPGTYTWSSQGHTDDYGMIYFAINVGGFTLRSSGGPEVTILDAQYQGRVMFVQAHNDIVVDGFTFVNGVAPNNYDAGGGLIGAFRSDCGTVGTEQSSWGALLKRFRK